MLVADSVLNDIPIFSIQTGTKIASVKSPLINPYNLKIMAFELSGSQLDYSPAYLRVDDIREISVKGIIVNSSDEFVDINDIINLKKIFDLNFELIGIKVVDTSKKIIGKVEGFNFNINDFVIWQLNIKKPFLKSFGISNLLIHRTQIIEIAKSYIVVNSGHVAVKMNKYNKFTSIFQKNKHPQPETFSSKESN